MVSRCVVAGCSNVSHHSAVWEEVVSLHMFPKGGSQRKAWTTFVKQRRSDWEPTSVSLICSKHFKDDSFDNQMHYLFMAAQGDSSIRLRLKKGAIPSINQVRKEDGGPSKRQRRSNTRLVRELREGRPFTTDTSSFFENNDEVEIEGEIPVDLNLICQSEAIRKLLEAADVLSERCDLDVCVAIAAPKRVQLWTSTGWKTGLKDTMRETVNLQADLEKENIVVDMFAEMDNISSQRSDTPSSGKPNEEGRPVDSATLNGTSSESQVEHQCSRGQKGCETRPKNRSSKIDDSAAATRSKTTHRVKIRDIVDDNLIPYYYDIEEKIKSEPTDEDTLEEYIYKGNAAATTSKTTLRVNICDFMDDNLIPDYYDIEDKIQHEPTGIDVCDVPSRVTLLDTQLASTDDSLLLPTPSRSRTKKFECDKSAATTSKTTHRVKICDFMDDNLIPDYYDIEDKIQHEPTAPHSLAAKDVGMEFHVKSDAGESEFDKQTRALSRVNRGGIDVCDVPSRITLLDRQPVSMDNSLLLLTSSRSERKKIRVGRYQ